MQKPPLPLTRRQFIARSSAASAAFAAPLVLPSRRFGQTAPGNKITLGLIGAGHIATGHLDTLLGYADTVRILAICDVDRERRDVAAARVNRAYGSNDCKAIADFRELNRRSDIDAVYICTPDH
jgi:ornithine cyclodeaminase/alanine dehydrogenase-like protein (mu-crystallin family)